MKYSEPNRYCGYERKFVLSNTAKITSQSTFGIFNLVLASVTMVSLKPPAKASGVKVDKFRHLLQSTKSRRRTKFSDGSSTAINSVL